MVMKACRKKNAKALKDHLDNFNGLLEGLKEDGAFETNEITGPAASQELVGHVLEQAYARSVAPESHTLRQYQGM